MRESTKSRRTARKGDVVQQAPEMLVADKIKVFISYEHTDSAIALALYEELIGINRDRVACFLDSEIIDSGAGWEEKIKIALNEAEWLIRIYTGEQSEFCGYEVGVFTSGKMLEKSQKSEKSRLVCLYDSDKYPVVFQAHQNRKIEYPPEHVADGETFDENVFYKKSQIAKFFENFCDYKDIYTSTDGAENERKAQTIIRKAKRITDAFRASHGNDVRYDTPTQLGLEVSVLCRGAVFPTAIPMDAMAKGTFQSFHLFGLMPPSREQQLPSASWGSIREACQQKTTPQVQWIDRIERDMLSAAAERVLTAPEAVFKYGSKIYRAILTRDITQWDGTHRFHIVFVEMLRDKFTGNQNTSMILAGIVLASRFRFAYLEQRSKIDKQFSENVGLVEFEANYRQFLLDLERIKREAGQLGLLDETLFVEAFGSSRRAIAESFLKTSKEARAKLTSMLPAANDVITSDNRITIRSAIFSFLDSVEAENARFLKVALEAYTDAIEAQAHTQV